jgi:hypothetical protein
MTREINENEIIWTNIIVQKKFEQPSPYTTFSIPIKHFNIKLSDFRMA